MNFPRTCWFATCFALAACAPASIDPVSQAPAGPAPLLDPSDGCPQLGASGEAVTLSSGGVDRRVTVVHPATVEPGMPVLFTFHGLTSPAYDPMGSMVAGFDLQAEADERGVIFVVPEAREVELPLVGVVSLWGILDDEGPDLQLYDDLRTCIVEAFDADPARVGAWGHSGGALWTSIVARDRSDTLAAFAELSGGAGIELPVLGGPFVEWEPVGGPVPSLLVTGGETDVWPDPTFTLIDFVAATESLADALVADGQLVGRCDHGKGHFAVPPKTLRTTLDWLLDHRYGEPSPYQGTDLGDDCWWAAESGISVR